MTTAIDVAIGLILMYLVLSLFCTTLNEFISSLISLRATTLKAALKALIDDPNLRSLFYNHGLIDGAKTASSAGATPTSPTVATPAVVAPADGAAMADRVAPPPAPQGFFTKLWAGWKNTHPSYLSSKTVAMALIGSLGTTKDAPIPQFEAVANAVVKGLPDCNIRDVLITCIAQADGDIDKLRDSIANWFDSAMDRLSGAYKRSVQLIAFTIGILVAIGFNADTLKVAKTLWAEPRAAASLSQAASNLVADNQKCAPPAQCANGAQSGSSPAATGTQGGNTATGSASAQPPAPAKDSAKISLPSSDNCTKPDSSAPALVDEAYRLCLANAYLQNGPLSVLPIGWQSPHWPSLDEIGNWFSTGTWWLQILGWLITAIALTLGAPFWFDLLVQFVNLRGTGQKPEPAAKSAKGA